MGLKLRETKTQGTHIHASEAYHALPRRWSKPDKWPNWVKKGGESPGAEGRWEKRETWVYFFKQGSPGEITGLFSCFHLTEVTALGSGGSLREKAFAFNHDSHTWHQQTLMRSPANWDGEWQAGGGPGECSRALGHLLTLGEPTGNGLTATLLIDIFLSVFSWLAHRVEFPGLPFTQATILLHPDSQNSELWLLKLELPQIWGGGRGETAMRLRKLWFFFMIPIYQKKNFPLLNSKGKSADGDINRNESCCPIFPTGFGQKQQKHSPADYFR